jgi:hypothetical protein
MPETTSEPNIIIQLFNAAGVKRVVFIDDRFGISAARIQSDANELTVEQLQSCEAFPKVDFSADNEEVKRSAIAKTIEEAPSGDLELMFDKMAVLRYEYEDTAKDYNARQYFEKVVAPAAETLYLSLREWENAKTALLAEADSKPTLFIFDEDFRLEGQSATHGRQLIDQTHAKNPGYKFIYALLTHNVQSDEAEIQLQSEIAAQWPSVAEYLLVIAKNRLSESGDRFAERMKQLLLYRLFQVLKRKLTSETAEASKLAIKEVEGLGIESFERIILGTSRAEGAWSPDTLVRVIGVYQQQQIEQNIRKDAELHRVVREIDPICEVKTSPKGGDVDAQAQRLQHDEIYLKGERINSVHLPIASGDIFADGAGEQYVIVAQPCDLMVRSGGYRWKDERETRHMVPLVRVRKVESKFKDHGLPSDQYDLPHYHPKERWSVRLNEVSYLPSWLLDLAVLSEDGRCVVAEGQSASPLLISPWLKRLPKLLERAGAIVASVARITDEGVDKKVLVQSYCRIPLGSPFEVAISESAEGTPHWTMALNLARKARIAEQHATALLIEYAAFIARPAHPHDLTRV